MIQFLGSSQNAIPELPPFNARAERWQEMYPEWWEAFVEKFSDQIPDEILPVGEKLKGKTLKVYNRLMEVPQTFIHGDFRLDNLFFYGDGASIAVIDWQGYAYGPATWDVTRFLVGSLDPEDRSAKVLDLLKNYHGLLVDRGIQNYIYSQLENDFRLTLLSMWIFVVAVSANLNVEVNERSRALINKALQRVCAAILDHQAVDLMPE